MNPLTVVYDACVLFPAPLRSLFMYQALTDTFKARWTNAIHEEWMRSVTEKYKDISRPQVERIRDLMNAHVRDCLVADYEHLIPSLTLPDPDDRHVLAAAITCKADTIVTFNLKDFPSESLAPFEIVAQHPDEFLAQMLDRHAGLFCSAVKKQRESLKNPPKSVEEFLATLEQSQLSVTVSKLRHFAELI